MALQKVINRIKRTMLPIETKLIVILWKNPVLYFDYQDKLTYKMFMNERCRFFFRLGLELLTNSIEQFDEGDVKVFLSSREKLKSKFDEYDGDEFLSIIHECDQSGASIEAFINDLMKWSHLCSIIKEFDFNEENVISEFEDLNAQEVLDYFEFKLADTFINSDENVLISSLDEGLDEMIEEADMGLLRGSPYSNSPILDRVTGGKMLGQITLVGALSGAGKTTITNLCYIQPAIEFGEKTVVLLNEQTKQHWQRDCLTFIINNIVLKDKDKYFGKRRWRDGKFSVEERQWLEQAKQILIDKVKDKTIVIAEMIMYTRKYAEQLIKRFAKMGYQYFVLDTFKISSERDSNEQFWLSMQEDMRAYHDLIKPANLNVNLWVTFQLEKGQSSFKRYLNSSNFGMSKNTEDVASVSLLLRRVRNDEYEGDRNEITVTEIIDIDGELNTSGSGVIQYKLTDKNKKHILIFINKNRNGESQEFQIVAEMDYGAMRYRELGITDIPVD